MKKLLLPALILFCMGMILFPQESFSAAGRGLLLWQQRILPALLPFFISAELLMRIGAADLLGKLLKPLMRPLFNLPGEAALALALGYTAGFPTGAMVTASLRKNGSCSRKEGERLIAFTNNASPLFIIVAVATGILNEPELGFFLAAIHYGSNLCIGFLLGLWSRRDQKEIPAKGDFTEIKELPMTESIGAMLKAACSKAFNNLLLIGALMVFFAVLTQLLTTSASLCFLQTKNQQALTAGFWEISLGVDAIAATQLGLSQKAALISAVMAWGGLSIQAQVSAMMSGTDIRMHTYFCSRVLQSILAYALTLLFLSQKTIATAGQLLHPVFAGYTVYHGWLFCGCVVFAVCALKLLRKIKIIF